MWPFRRRRKQEEEKKGHLARRVIAGVIIGGGLMGLIENYFGYFWPEWKPIIAFIVIVLVLCIRPSGLFAKHYIKKV